MTDHSTHIFIGAAGRLLGLTERETWWRVRRGDFLDVVYKIDPATGYTSAHVSLDEFGRRGFAISVLAERRFINEQLVVFRLTSARSPTPI